MHDSMHKWALKALLRSYRELERDQETTVVREVLLRGKFRGSINEHICSYFYILVVRVIH